MDSVKTKKRRKTAMRRKKKEEGGAEGDGVDSKGQGKKKK